jgi:arabinofuranan 3-O-arabinosyltransferase
VTTRSRLTAGVSRANLALLALIAYVPALLTKPGRMPADTKLFLYLDPGRLITDAPFTWDTRQFGGWVPHQTIAYLWPQGPWYWFFDKLGVPDWVAHRLWIGTLLFLGAWGVMWAARLLGLTRGGALAAAVTYQLSPYILPYLSRTSAMLLPWAALGWIVGLTIRAATSGHRWRHPALLALVLLSCSAVNATAVMMIAPAPILWLGHSVAQRTVTWQRAVAAAARIGLLATGVSLWWIFMLRAQGAYGADVLAYSESLQATSLTSLSTETLRGAGYWLFYVRDPYAFTTTAAQHYMESGRALFIGFAIVVVCLLGLALVRWSQRRYAVLLVFAGIVLGAGVHPIDNASPLMRPLAENSRSTLALAIRSSTRALPMSNLGLALGIGALVTAVAGTRLRTRAFAPVLVVLVAVVNLPVLWNGGMVDPALERDQEPPAAWQQAADDLSATSPEYRVLQLPGSEFGAFRWGYTVDPPLPGMTTKPLVTRDLLPLGSAGLMDLLYSLDDRVQSGTLSPESLAPVARLLGVDTVWLANDLAYDRFRTPRPEVAAAEITAAPGLGAPKNYGDPVVNRPTIPMVDEHALVAARHGDTPLPPVQLVPVDRPSAIIRASDRVVVLAGSGDGVVDAAAAGLLDGSEALLYAADVGSSSPSDTLHGVTPTAIVLTDSNRDRAHHWRSSQDVTGFTESGGDGADLLRPDEGDQRLPVFGTANDPADQTIAVLDGGLTVRATGYGEPFAYRPEDRPAMAVDGDPTTAWVVADRAEALGQSITVSTTDGSLTLLQPQGTNANRMIDAVVITTPTDSVGHRVRLDGRSLVQPGEPVDVPAGVPVTITITEIGDRAGGTDTGPSAMGFAELGVGSHPEVVRLPRYAAAADVPLDVVLTRLRTDPLNRWRSDPEPTMVRQFDLGGTRSFTGSVTLRLHARATDEVLDAVSGVRGALANRRLAGDVQSRGVFATDDDPTTAWTSPFVDAIGSALTFTTTGAPVTTITLQQPVDTLHSLISVVSVNHDGQEQQLGVPAPDAQGRSTITLPTPVTGGMFRLSVKDVVPTITFDRRFAEATVLPVSLIEVTGDGIARTSVASRTVQPGCTSGLVTIDGTPAGVELDTPAIEALLDGRPATVQLCDSLTLDAGTHRLVTSPGRTTGIDVDQLTLRDVAGADASLAGGSASPSVDVSVTRSRSTRTATVGACPTGCWLIMGEGWNTGWSAEVDGTSLGTPTQIAGGMNGWWLPAHDAAVTVHLQWNAQTPVTAALGASLLVTLLCLYLGLRRRPARLTDVTFIPAPPRLDRRAWARSGWWGAFGAATVLVVTTALIASPRAGLIAIVPAAIVVAARRPRLAALGSALVMAALGVLVIGRQLANRYSANAAWPGFFEDLHRPGMLVVSLLLAGALIAQRDEA